MKDISYKLTRTVTKVECPWLDRDVPEGTIVTRFTGCTYGCISPNGFAANVPGMQGSVELPNNCVQQQE